MAKPVADMLRSSVAVTVFHMASAHHLNFSNVKDVAGVDNLRACSRGTKTFGPGLTGVTMPLTYLMTLLPLTTKSSFVVATLPLYHDQRSVPVSDHKRSR